MKPFIYNQLLLAVLITGIGLIPTGRLTAQIFTTLHSFGAVGIDPIGLYTNSDGASPNGSLIISGNTLYGTAVEGGSSGNGTVFKLNTDSTGFTILHSFTATPNYINSDGAGPFAGLVLSGKTLYGTASSGGSFGSGTVFKLNTDGSGFRTLHSFTTPPNPAPSPNSDGAVPFARLILAGDTLYGTANQGGSFGYGTLFKLTTNGTSFTTLHSFAGGSDGASPLAELILSSATLYGSASVGGTSGNGTVFAVNTDGTGFTTLYSFATTSGSPEYTNSDGSGPRGLILSGNTLYGTALAGGSSARGTVFALNTNGTGFTTLYSFSAVGIEPTGVYTNSDGANPRAGLILSGNALYGAGFYAGSSGHGTVFAVNTDGMGFTVLHSFTEADPNTGANSDGANPYAGLILSDTSLYGTAVGGGASGSGAVFSLSLPQPPQLTIIRSGPNVILTWPTNATGFALQTSPNLDSPNSWIAATYSSVIVGDQYFLTNNISGSAQFYRLKK